MTTPNPLKGYLVIQRQFDRRLIRILETAAKSIQRRIARLEISDKFSDRVRTSQLRLVLATIRRELSQMFLSIGDVTRAGQLAAAIQAMDDLEFIRNVIFASVTREAADNLFDSIRFTAEAGLKNFYARTPRELSERLYKARAWSEGKIQEAIRDGLIRGASARELAKDVYKFVSPTAPGGASYVSMRLARTEINNAFHNQQRTNFDSPWVEAIRWNLSGSHPRKDECNRLAETDQYSLGRGTFPKRSVPGKPHPQCLCYLTAVTLSPNQFVSNLKDGKYDDELRRRYNANLAALKG